MNNWFCLKCDFATDVFKEVWEHCKGTSHIMQLHNTSEDHKQT